MFQQVVFQYSLYVSSTSYFNTQSFSILFMFHHFFINIITIPPLLPHPFLYLCHLLSPIPPPPSFIHTPTPHTPLLKSFLFFNLQSFLCSLESFFSFFSCFFLSSHFLSLQFFSFYFYSPHFHLLSVYFLSQQNYILYLFPLKPLIQT